MTATADQATYIRSEMDSARQLIGMLSRTLDRIELALDVPPPEEAASRQFHPTANPTAPADRPPYARPHQPVDEEARLKVLTFGGLREVGEGAAAEAEVPATPAADG